MTSDGCHQIGGRDIPFIKPSLILDLGIAFCANVSTSHADQYPMFAASFNGRDGTIKHSIGGQLRHIDGIFRCRMTNNLGKLRESHALSKYHIVEFIWFIGMHYWLTTFCKLGSDW